MISREEIYNGVFEQLQALQTNSQFVTVDRKLQAFDKVDAALQPALFQLQAGKSIKQERSRPPVYTLNLELFIYCYNADPTPGHYPSKILNPLLDLVCGIFEAPPGEQVQTFNIPSVQRIWVEGKIMIAEGVLAKQVVAVVPVIIQAI